MELLWSMMIEGPKKVLLPYFGTAPPPGHIESIMQMSPEVQAVVMNTLQTVFVRESSPGVETMPGPASFHPNQKTITEQLETTTRARDEAVARVHELEIQVIFLTFLSCCFLPKVKLLQFVQLWKQTITSRIFILFLRKLYLKNFIWKFILIVSCCSIGMINCAPYSASPRYRPALFIVMNWINFF